MAENLWEPSEEQKKQANMTRFESLADASSFASEAKQSLPIGGGLPRRSDKLDLLTKQQFLID